MSKVSAPPAQPAAKDDKDHFLAHMGHDLRAPMTNILALTEAVLDGVYGPVPPLQSEQLRHIRDNGHRMINMVSDLVDLARFNTGQNKLEPAACEVMGACRSGFDVARGMAELKRVTITSEMSPPSVTALADAKRIRQLASNLSVAAVVSAPAEGNVLLRVAARPQEGRLWLQALISKRAVQNLPAEQSASDPATAAAALLRLRKMSSVAVTVVERLSQLHGGGMEVAEREGVIGVTVALCMAFPAPTETAKPAEPAPANEATPPAGAPGAPLILLADDEEIIRTITKDYLEGTGYRVICATNGAEALEWITKESPDLVILDMQMPILDGMEALQRMRASQDARIAKIPVISLSGLVTPGHKERCLAAGATGCLAKPFGIKDLERVIKDSLGQTS